MTARIFSLLSSIALIAGVTYGQHRARYRSSVYAGLTPTDRFTADRFSLTVSLIGYIVVCIYEFVWIEDPANYVSPVDGFSDYATFRI